MPEYNGGMEKEYKNPYLMPEDHWLNEATDHWFSPWPPYEPTQEEKDNILPKSEEWKEYMSERMTGEDNPMWGKKNSKRQREAASRANKGVKKWYKVANNRPILHGADNPKSKEVTIHGVTYPTHTAAAKALGIPRSTLTWRINKGRI